MVRTLLSLSDVPNILIVGEPGVGKSSICQNIVSRYYGPQHTPDVVRDNVLFINSLKDQGVSFYRTEVRCFCQTKGSLNTRKKIIVVDDMDTITEAGQQVFLSYIDTFKTNIIFIATCRCPSKILENIHSRVTAVQLPRFSDAFLEALSRRVLASEKIAAEEGAITAMSRRCNHSVRTLLNYLEKFRLLKTPITVALVRAHCSMVQDDYLEEMLGCIAAKDLRGAIRSAERIYAAGYSVMDTLDAIFAYVKQSECGLTEVQTYDIIQVLTKYIYLVTHAHEHPIEVYFFLYECVEHI